MTVRRTCPNDCSTRRAIAHLYTSRVLGADGRSRGTQAWARAREATGPEKESAGAEYNLSASEIRFRGEVRTESRVQGTFAAARGEGSEWSNSGGQCFCTGKAVAIPQNASNNGTGQIEMQQRDTLVADVITTSLLHGESSLTDTRMAETDVEEKRIPTTKRVGRNEIRHR